MLTKVERKDVPRYRGRELSGVRVFAAETLAEFLEGSAEGEVAEVTGCPGEPGAARLAQALRDELHYMGRDRGEDLRRAVRVITRGGERVFLERTA